MDPVSTISSGNGGDSRSTCGTGGTGGTGGTDTSTSATFGRPNTVSVTSAVVGRLQWYFLGRKIPVSLSAAIRRAVTLLCPTHAAPMRASFLTAVISMISTRAACNFRSLVPTIADNFVRNMYIGTVPPGTCVTAMVGRCSSS